MLEELRKQVCDLHAKLPENNLVAWTSGNISGRDPETNLVVIKPSGVKFEDLTPDKMVVVNIDGEIVEGDYKASSDTASHCYIYRHMPRCLRYCAYPFPLCDGFRSSWQRNTLLNHSNGR